MELIGKVICWQIHAWVGEDVELLTIGLAFYGENQIVFAGKHQRTRRLKAWSRTWNRMIGKRVFGVAEALAEVAVRKRDRMGVAEVPDEATDAGGNRQGRRRIEPEFRNIGREG